MRSRAASLDAAATLNALARAPPGHYKRRFRARSDTPGGGARQPEGMFDMAATKQLAAVARNGIGKGAARSVRREGRVPGVIYGGGESPEPISIDSLPKR